MRFISTEINNYVLGQKDNKVNIVFTNTIEQDEEPLPAPTGFDSRHTPFILLLVFGAMLLTLSGFGIIRSRKRTPETEPAKNRVQSHHIWVKYTPPRGRGAPPSAPPCPRAALWAQMQGSTEKRGDPKA